MRLRYLFISGLLTCLLLLPGCLSSLSPLGGYTFDNGRLEANISATVPATAAATRTALDKFNCILLLYRANATDGLVIATTVNNDRVEVEVKKVDNSNSQVSIHIGTGGDEDTSRQLLDSIRSLAR